MSEENKKPIIGISVGDLNGIGMEVIIKTLENPDILELCTPVVFASAKVASYHRNVLDKKGFSFHIINSIKEVNPKKPNLLNCWKEEVNLNLGEENPAIGVYAVKSIEQACNHLDKNEIDALVTAPIHKKVIQSKDFNFSGHTDYLESRYKSKGIMMLVSEEMRMALTTVHISLNKVTESINTDLINKKLHILNSSLKSDFHIRKPKIAVLSIDPHAGDNGVIGTIDQNVVEPAIASASEKGIMAFGPYPADSFFGSGKHKQFDAILAMYHDQGLVAFKSLSFGKGVNYTAGLPIVRTSPDHGTAFDIAGQGKANESSFRESVYLACDLVKRRKTTQELKANPLKTKSKKK